MEQSRNCSEIVKVIRTLLASAKNGLLINEIVDDFKQTEGKEIPIKSLGYNTLEELLRDTNQFAMFDTKHGIKVMSKPSKDTTVNKSATNSPSKMKKKGGMMPPQRALRPTTDNHWNGTAYSQAYTQMPNRSVKKIFAQPAKLLQASHSNGNSGGGGGGGGAYRPILKQSNIKHGPKDETVYANDDTNPSTNQMIQSTKPFSQRMPNNQSNNGTSITWNQYRSSHHERIVKKSNETVAPKSSVQSRLAIQKTISTQSTDISTTQPNISTTQISSVECDDNTKHNFTDNRIIEKMKYTQIGDSKQMPYVMLINGYCRQKGYADPAYSFSQTKARKFTCKVTVGPAIYASYPNEFNTQLEAQNEAARIAYNNIEEIEHTEKFPICMDSMAEIANKMFECISENGVFLKFIPQLFQEKYDMTLPDGWMNIIEDNPHLFSIAKDSLMDRVYPNLQHRKIDNGTQSQKVKDLDELMLPWNDKHWNIFITSVSSTVDIWGRLIGPEYSAKLDSILDDIETELVSGGSKIPCTNLSVGKYCYITNPDCYRVRIEKIDDARKMALCFLIDYGDEEWWSLDQIYEGDGDLFQLPAQAIRFSLFNLEDFAENPHAKQEIDEYLAGKTLIAEIKSTQSEYQAQCESSVDAKIKAIFYDTSSDDDVQLNKVILEKICEKVEPPQLQRSKWNPVCVSYIGDNGDIYVQLHNDKGNTVHNIKQLIHRLTQNGFNKQFAQINPQFVSSGNELYLIQDTTDFKWYRAVILANKSKEAGDASELCKYVDYGMMKYVPHENIFRLDLLSTALSKYPHQAMLVRLHNIDNYNPKTVARLRGLLCAGTTVLAQIESYTSMIPMVNICKRLENNILCKINDTIRMEHEIESSVDLLLETDKSALVNSAAQTKVITDLRLYPEPSLNKFFNVIVVTAPNPSNFFVRPCNEEVEFKKMMMQLKCHCENVPKNVRSEDITVDQYYAALLQDGYWYRVKIQRVLPADTVAVYKCDFGDITFLNTDSLRTLTTEFRQMPQLAIPAHLHGIQPKNSTWNNDDCAYFQQLTVQKQFASEIKAIRKEPSDHSYILEMILIDVSTANDLNINENLVQNQHANII